MGRLARYLLILALILLPTLLWGKESSSVPRKKKTTASAKKSTKTSQRSGEKKEAAEAPSDEKDTAVLTGMVTEIRHWSNPDYTRVAIHLDREAHYEAHKLPADPSKSLPPRLYIDIRGVKLAPGVKDLPIGDGLLRTARVAQYRSDIVRVVLDMESIKDYNVFTFSDPFRIIVDVKGKYRQEISRPKAPAITNLQPMAPVKADPVVSIPASETQKAPARILPGKIRRVVVDPGHGGHDPGAIGARGTKEKDVVLQIGLRLARKLREDLGLDVVLTRSTDVFLELQERTALANKVGADLFVSVHANAALNRATSGIETYYLNLAKTEKAAQLAAKENGTSLEKVSLLQAVLFDLMANYKINDSAHLAEEVQKALHRKVNGHRGTIKNLGVKQGPFYVLVGATMPSILVETAFVSNEKEEEHLNDPAYQEETAEGIADGIRNYISTLK